MACKWADGRLRILQFSPSHKAIRVRTYFPVLDSLEVDAESEFTLPYDMTTATGIAWTPELPPAALPLIRTA